MTKDEIFTDSNSPENKLKLAFVCNPNMGGSGIIATELAMALALRGHEVHMLALSKPFRLDSDIPNLHFHMVGVNDYPAFESSPHILSLAGALAECIDEHDIDVMHAHYALPYAAVAILAQKTCDKPVSIVTTLHGTDIVTLSDDPALRSVIKMTLKSSDIITAVSSELAQTTKDYYGKKLHPLAVPNFISEKILEPLDKAALRKEFDLNPDTFYLVHASNFRPVKRIPDIIKALALINEKEHAELILLGIGPEMDNCIALAEELGVRDKIIFTGKSTVAWKWMAAADVNMQLSEYESFGLTLVEAMVHGTPSVVYNVGGMPYVVGDTGCIVDQYDYPLAANQVIEWIRSPALMEDQSQRCKDRALSTFTVDKVCEQYEKVYRSCIRKQTGK